MTGGSEGALQRAVELFARIRREGEWESAQTHASLLPYLVEETWELVDCVSEPGGPERDELVSELGDLLLQVLFHSAIGAERDDRPFDVDVVAQSMLDKLHRRAPYWFADDGAGEGAGGSVGGGSAGLTAVEQDKLWQEAKLAERAGRPTRGVLHGVAWGQPALALGQKVIEKALAAGLPGDLVPEELTTVRVRPTTNFSGGPGPVRDPARGNDPARESDPPPGSDSSSVEIAYRTTVRRFADRLLAAESRLDTVPASADQWRSAWE